MKHRVIHLTFLVVICAISGNAQPSGWKTARGSGLQFDVPRNFQTTSGTTPAVLSDGPSTQMFELRYLTAINTQRYIFANAGYGHVQISPYFQGDMEDLASLSLSRLLGTLVIPDVGTMRLDLENAEVSEYKTMGIQVSETTARSLGTGREYRVYFALAFKRASRNRAKIIHMVVGCPESDIEDTNQVLSTILASFKEP